MIDFIDKTDEQAGTPINRQNMMAIQGIQAKTITANTDGSVITCIYDNGNSLITTFDVNNAQIVETFTGEKIVTKTTSQKNGTITEVIS